jgi:hypothetical protein
MRGRSIALSPFRRLITDVMRYAIAVPGVPTERVMELGAVIAARNAVPYRPAWAGIFAKACALTAREFPELRRAYFKWPWPRLYEYPDSIATITINREHNGEACVLPLLVMDPASLPIHTIDTVINRYVQSPVTEVRAFQRAIAVGKLPGVLRRPMMWAGYNMPRWRANYFGTFAVTSVAFKGSELLYVPTLTTSLLTFGVFGPDGRTPVRMVIDHRVMDGMEFAAILARLEAIMNGPILQELRSEAGLDRLGHAEPRGEAEVRSILSSGKRAAS